MIKHPIFMRLNEKEQEKALEFFEKREVKEGEIIVKEGEYSSIAFILLKGELTILKATIYKDDYLKTDIKAPSDEFFNEVNLIDRGLVTSTIKAKVDSEILQIDHDSFISLLDTYPTIGSKMLWVISYNLTQHLRKAQKDVLTLFNALVEVVEND